MNDFYTYELAYPDGTVFYVGKGTRDRINDHERDARLGKKTYKCNVIRQIWASGGQVIKTKVQQNMSEEAAYRLEIDLIRMYGREHLTNLTDGGEGGEGGARTGAGRPHTHILYVCVEFIDAQGDKDCVYTGNLLRSNDAIRRAEEIAAHHVGEQARSVRILKRLCCSIDDSEVLKVVKASAEII